MPDNFFDGSLIDMCFGKQRNCGVPAAVRRMIDMQTKHQGLENIVVIHVIGKMLAVQSMDEIFTIGTVMKPALIKGSTLSAIGTFRMPFSVLLSMTSKYCSDR